MQGMRYMLLGIAIMVLGYGLSELSAVLYVLYGFGAIGFLLVLYGFHIANPKCMVLNEKKIGMVKPGKEYGIVEIRTADYDKMSHAYICKDSKMHQYNISPNCVLKMSTMGCSYSHTNVPYEWWKNQEEEKLYCIGFDLSMIVYMEEINEVFKL